ncbi:MAG: hypothetical protein AB8G15_18795 [Saprospiraceae bacterium]
MTIQYLKKLQNNPNLSDFPMEGISIEEIERLEQLYNRGKVFPKVLRELLFLAGKFCAVLDFSIYDSQEEMQAEERAELLEIFNVQIERPHFFVCLASHGMPVFMYLDEGNNPSMYQIRGQPTQERYADHRLGSLDMLINHRITDSLNGKNPF